MIMETSATCSNPIFAQIIKMASHGKARAVAPIDKAAALISTAREAWQERQPSPKKQAGEIRPREYVQTELPPPLQAAFRPMVKTQQVSQMPDGRFVREEAFVLASSAFQQDPRFAGQQVSSRIKTSHYWDTAPVKNKSGQEYQMVQDWAKCKVCGKRPTDPDLLVNMCTDPGTVPEGKKVLVQILYVPKEEGDPQAQQQVAETQDAEH